MLRAGVWLVSRAGRTAAAAAGLMTLLALQPEPARVVEAASAGTVPEARVTHTLVLSDQARRYLSLQYKSFATEFMGCMIGEVRGQTVVVSRIAPADVEPAQSAATHVVPKESCESAGWTGTVGMIHSHPTGDRCWYFFPGTQVASSDGVSFARQHYPVDAIMCGTYVAWVGRDMQQHQFPIRLVRPRFHELLERRGLGADEAALEVRVDCAGGVEGGLATADRPGAHLVLAHREERLETEQTIARVD